ncbi:MAG: hypothetical protein AB7V50_01665, partial [Vampirovibrionia bacterium]
YLKKENIVAFKGKKSTKPAARKEPLDISRSLSRSTRTSRPLTTSSRMVTSNLDRTNRPISKSTNRLNTNTASIKKHTAISGYSKQQQTPQKPVNLVKKAKQTQTLSNNPLLNKELFNKQLNVPNKATQIAKNNIDIKKTYNVDFLRSMADHYEKTGRHDLAKNIKKSLNKSTT